MAPDRKLYRQLITIAQHQFKLSVALRAHCASAQPENGLSYLEIFSFGKHVAGPEELSLTPEQEQFAAAALEHSATYVMAVQIDTALQAVFPHRFSHSCPEVQHSSWIARLTRNAFAHDPLNPIWLTYPECENKVYSIEGIISLSTSALKGKEVQRMHYGGPLALLRFAEFVKTQLICEEPVNPALKGTRVDVSSS
jgi:hypothetical protein